jgi:hypothetical protein
MCVHAYVSLYLYVYVYTQPRPMIGSTPLGAYALVGLKRALSFHVPSLSLLNPDPLIN